MASPADRLDAVRAPAHDAARGAPVGMAGEVVEPAGDRRSTTARPLGIELGRCTAPPVLDGRPQRPVKLLAAEVLRRRVEDVLDLVVEIGEDERGVHPDRDPPAGDVPLHAEIARPLLSAHDAPLESAVEPAGVAHDPSPVLFDVVAEAVAHRTTPYSVNRSTNVDGSSPR